MNRKILALILIFCLTLPVAVSAAELENLENEVEALYQMEAWPACWSGLEKRTAEEDLLLQLTTDRLYVRSADGRELMPSLASALPRDVTADYAGTYGIPGDAVRGYAFVIELNPDSGWQDGKAVTVMDWLFTLNQLIDRKESLLNFAGLEEFYSGAEKATEKVISLQKAGFSSVEEAREAGREQFYVDLGHFWGLDAGWVSTESNLRLKDAAIPSGVTEMYVSGAYIFDRYLRTGAEQSVFQSQFVGVSAEPAFASREDIGLIALEEHSFAVILAQPTTAEALAVKLGQLIPVREALFAGNYATSLATYSSCGPWKITALEDGEITLEPNSHWRGAAQTVEADRIRLLG